VRKQGTSIARKQSESGEHERTNTSEGLRFNLTGRTILKISILENGVGLETAELLLLTLHVNLKLSFAARYAITLDCIGLLGVPTTAAGLLADRRGIPKGIGG
jgi:hypothetical protein